MDELKWCIDYLSKYNHINKLLNVYDFNTFRALMNITTPYSLSDEYYKYQDEIIKNELKKKDIIDVSTFNDISIYKGDIISLKADVIVNACNEKLLGCFSPLHNCIDNAIHSFAGLEMRRDLMEIMDKQNHDEENGKCKVTKGYNLNAKYVFHTVGPKIFGNVTKENENDLRNCYLSSLKMAIDMKLNSIVFPCISTGIYGYPKDLARDLAIKTVKEFLNENNSNIKVIFNVFTDYDYKLYKEKLE